MASSRAARAISNWPGPWRAGSESASSSDTERWSLPRYARRPQNTMFGAAEREGSHFMRIAW
eukprot:7146255-Prymnesium_polylepis.2